MTKIKFGTDGWRAIIAKEYTVDNVCRVTIAVSQWLKSNFDKPSVVVGHDCRFGGPMFVDAVCKVLTANGIKVITTDKGFVSTPMISYATREFKASLGVVITASHNPPTYNGYKLKGDFGGPLLPDQVDEIEQLIPDTNSYDVDSISLSEAKANKLYEIVDLEQMYIDKVKSTFDLDLIANADFGWAYDAMYGAGQNVMKRLLPDIAFLHCEHNPGFMGQAPEPIDKNLQEFSMLMKQNHGLSCGLATDGDADRIGLYNSRGEFVDSHHIILLTIHYLVKYKGLSGKVVTGFSSTPRIKQMCEHYGLEHEEVKIGFKYIAGFMADPSEDVLLGGEESGGIALKTFIPERDGIWMGLTIWEFMAKTGKSLDELIQEVYEIVGPFAFERNDLHINESLKVSIIEKCKSDTFHMFGKYKVKSVDDLDGFKYHFDENRWLMIRPSGTEPVLRTYAEAPTLEEVRVILEACKLTIGA
ncbi:phosphoglucomutase/phosphomannomutase family protein [Paracrocinitomix mangrovi]|uniref:phosphoglucomutase/phosphomannomutase family protein n=1 Tax=Paracrocinitomix mangrovi TaxID=2862509 RepID=UPI001C8D252A|nr:phosphoglucomutase/phosphomannomutase family protein [Paracrocinitomix mangrovi]UKN02526.1 phosphoglucomutase/phosphomannomutase family protein [Paracrocinitomix mangrovi]